MYDAVGFYLRNLVPVRIPNLAVLSLTYTNAPSFCVNISGMASGWNTSLKKVQSRIRLVNGINFLSSDEV